MYWLHFDYEGTLSVPYPHDGSGWWRKRYIYSAYARTVLAGCPEDQTMLGPWFSLTPREIEVKPSPALHEIAHAQSDILKPQFSTFEECIEQVRQLTKRLELMK